MIDLSPSFLPCPFYVICACREPLRPVLQVKLRENNDTIDSCGVCYYLMSNASHTVQYLAGPGGVALLQCRRTVPVLCSRRVPRRKRGLLDARQEDYLLEGKILRTSEYVQHFFHSHTWSRGQWRQPGTASRRPTARTEDLLVVSVPGVPYVQYIVARF